MVVLTDGKSRPVSVETEIKLKASITASSLNVRSGPGTGYSRIAPLAKGNSVTVLSEVMKNDEEWYGISFSYNGKTIKGYVLSFYVKLSYGSGIKGNTAAKLKLRTTASSQAAYMKDNANDILTLAKGKTITILGETTVSGVKWLKLSVIITDKKYIGYAQADLITFKITEKQLTPTPIPKPTATPGPTEKPAQTPTPGVSYLQIANNPILSYISTPLNGFICNIPEINMVCNLVNFDNILDANNQPIVFKNAQRLLVNQVS